MTALFVVRDGGAIVGMATPVEFDAITRKEYMWNMRNLKYTISVIDETGAWRSTHLQA